MASDAATRAWTAAGPAGFVDNAESVAVVIGNPDQGESGHRRGTPYRNLDLVKGRIGPERRLVAMADPCLTSETGREGESLPSVSAPGLSPAKFKAAWIVVR